MANIFNIFKPKKPSPKLTNVVTMSGYEPTFSTFGNQVLYSSLVISSIHLKMRFFGKLEPRHIRKDKDNITSINDSNIAKTLRRPNFYQTPYDFLTQAYFMREKDNNCYIFIDKYKTKAGTYEVDGLYILLPSEKPQLCEDANGYLFYRFKFDGYSNYIDFDFKDIVNWKQNIEDNQYIGGGDYSINATADVLKSLNGYTEMVSATAEAAKLGCSFDGILKVNAYAAEGDKAKALRDQFINDLKTGKSGIGVLDNGADYQQVQRQLKMVDSATLKELKENVVITTGVSLEMLQGKFTQADKEALYENFIEPAAISLGQALSQALFTQQQQSTGNQVVLYPHKVQLMATSEIVSIIQSTISAGVFKIDEYREMLGYAPLENGEGQQRPRGYNNLDGSESATTQQTNNNDMEV